MRGLGTDFTIEAVELTLLLPCPIVDHAAFHRNDILQKPVRHYRVDRSYRFNASGRDCEVDRASARGRRGRAQVWQGGSSAIGHLVGKKVPTTATFVQVHLPSELAHHTGCQTANESCADDRYSTLFVRHSAFLVESSQVTGEPDKSRTRLLSVVQVRSACGKKSKCGETQSRKVTEQDFLW